MSIYAIGDTHLSLNKEVEKPMDILDLNGKTMQKG